MSLPKGWRWPIEKRISDKSRSDPSGCVLWDGGTDRHGYPLVWCENRMQYVSRIVLAKKLGRELKYNALHTCDVAGCINPEHLYEGTQSHNMSDTYKRGGRKMPDGIEEKILTAYKQPNMTTRKVARLLGVSQTYVCLTLTRKGTQENDGI